MERRRLELVQSLQRSLRELRDDGAAARLHVVSDEEGAEIRANENGLLLLASVALDRASGRSDVAVPSEAVCRSSNALVMDLDPEPCPAPGVRSPWQRALHYMYLSLVLIAGVGIWFVGVLRCVEWVEVRVAHLLR